MNKYVEEILPSGNPLKIDNLPLDIKKKIALNLFLKDIISFFGTSKILMKISNDIYFWQEYFKIQVPVNINIPLGADVDWYKNKIKEYPIVKQLNDLIILKKATVIYIQSPKLDMAGNEPNWDIFERIEKLKSFVLHGGELISFPSMSSLEQLHCPGCQIVSLEKVLELLLCLN